MYAFPGSAGPPGLALSEVSVYVVWPGAVVAMSVPEPDAVFSFREIW